MYVLKCGQDSGVMEEELYVLGTWFMSLSLNSILKRVDILIEYKIVFLLNFLFCLKGQ